jgi:hypothetical protein
MDTRCKPIFYALLETAQGFIKPKSKFRCRAKFLSGRQASRVLKTHKNAKLFATRRKIQTLQSGRELLSGYNSHQPAIDRKK